MSTESVRHLDLERILAKAEKQLGADNQYVAAEQLINDVLDLEPDYADAQRLRDQAEAMRDDHERRLVKARKLMVRRAFQQAYEILVPLQEDYPWDQRLQREIDRCETRAGYALSSDWAERQTTEDQGVSESPDEDEGLADPSPHDSTEHARENEDEIRAAELLDQARRCLLNYECEAAIRDAELGLETGLLTEPFRAVAEQAREGLRRRAELMQAFYGHLPDSDFDAARAALAEACELGLDDESREKAEGELADAIRHWKAAREEEWRRREREEYEPPEDDDDQRIVFTGPPPLVEGELPGETCEPPTENGDDSRTETYQPAPSSADDPQPQPYGRVPLADDDSETRAHEPAGTSGGGWRMFADREPASWGDWIRQLIDQALSLARGLQSWLLYSAARAFVVALVFGIVLTVVAMYAIFGSFGPASTTVEASPPAKEDLGRELTELRALFDQDLAAVSTELQQTQTSLTRLSEAMAAHNKAGREARAVDQRQARAMDAAIGTFAEVLVAIRAQPGDDAGADSPTTVETPQDDNKETKPEVGEAASDDKIVAEALRKLDEIRATLPAAEKEAGKHGKAGLHDCLPIEPCAKKDACITLRLPALDSAPRLTSQGAHSFALLLSAAAARGVENATIRSMNATHVCPTCHSKHGSDEPCVGEDAAKSEPAKR